MFQYMQALVKILESSYMFPTCVDRLWVLGFDLSHLSIISSFGCQYVVIRKSPQIRAST